MPKGKNSPKSPNTASRGHPGEASALLIPGGPDFQALPQRHNDVLWEASGPPLSPLQGYSPAGHPKDSSHARAKGASKSLRAGVGPEMVISPSLDRCTTEDQRGKGLAQKHTASMNHPALQGLNRQGPGRKAAGGPLRSPEAAPRTEAPHSRKVPSGGPLTRRCRGGNAQFRPHPLAAWPHIAMAR